MKLELPTAMKMRFLNAACILILVVNFSKSAVSIAGLQNNTYREMLFQRHPGHVLDLPSNMKNVRRMITNVFDEMRCYFDCLKENWCYSANFINQPQNNGLYVCEIISTDKHSNPQYLRKSKAFIHLSVEVRSKTNFQLFVKYSIVLFFIESNSF
jgi:hypothetical protein